MRPAKTQIRLRIRAVWSESLLDVLWIAKYQSLFQQIVNLSDCEDWSESFLVYMAEGNFLL